MIYEYNGKKYRMIDATALKDYKENQQDVCKMCAFDKDMDACYDAPDCVSYDGIIETCYVFIEQIEIDPEE